MYMSIKKKYLESALHVVKHADDEIKLMFKPDGIHIVTCDPGKIFMVSVVIKKEMFNEYNPGDLEIAIDIVKLTDYLKLYKKDDLLTFEYDEENNRLIAKNGTLTRTFGLVDTEGLMDPKTPQLKLSQTVMIDPALLLKTIQGIIPNRKYLNTVRIWTTSEGLHLEYIDDDDKNTALIEKNQGLSFISVSQDNQGSRYDCDFLIPILKELKKLTHEIIVMFDHNTPIHVCVDSEEIHVQYWLAPRIGEEDEIQEPIPEENPEEVKSETETQETTEPELKPGVIEQEVPLDAPVSVEKPGVTTEKTEPEPSIMLDPEPVVPVPDRPHEPLIAVRSKKRKNGVIGCRATLKTKTELIGEIVGITDKGYLVFFPDQKSKTLREPVEIERDLVIVHDEG